MAYYEKELSALQRSGRYRERRIFDPNVIDLASNDYLGLAENHGLFEHAVARLAREKVHAPKAAMLVKGYHPVHRTCEEALCRANGFEAGIVMGSGFNANIAMIESLVRKGDALFMDEKYHASGLLAAKLVEGSVTLFGHNDTDSLKSLLEASTAKRNLIAVEGIYSMDGDLMHPEIFDIADRFDAVLIVDEAHSSGVVGPNLLGVFDLFGITPRANHLKMGTLGKAYGSFGAYVLASGHICDYLLNRAKPVIYATAPSLFDTALGHAALEYILEHTETLKRQIARRQQIAEAELGIEMDGLIGVAEVGDNRKATAIQSEMLRQHYLVGAIRQPTVPHAIIRLIARTGVSETALSHACSVLRQLQD